jgi:glycosyltransferase involved in cell wall biosynthesis
LGINYIDALRSNDKALLTFTSWIKDIDFVTAGSDIIALTSLNEGTPVSLIEAQAANKPIISTNVGGIENISSPDSILLSENNNLNDFQSNFLKLVNDDVLRLSMQQKGWEFVKEKFHYTRLVKDMELLYFQALSKI